MENKTELLLRNPQRDGDDWQKERKRERDKERRGNIPVAVLGFISLLVFLVFFAPVFFVLVLVFVSVWDKVRD